MSFINPLARQKPSDSSIDFLAKRDADLANAEGALLTLYKDLEEHRSALYYEQSIRKHLEDELFRRDSEIQHLVKTITEMQEELKEQKPRTTIESLRKERELEEKIKFLESQLWSSQVPYPEGNKFGFDFEKQVVSSLAHPTAASSSAAPDITLEIDDFRQRYSALAMQVKLAKEEIHQRDITIQSLERKCKRLEDKEQQAQAELIGATNVDREDLERIVNSLENENKDLKERIINSNHMLEKSQLEIQNLTEAAVKSNERYLQLQREHKTYKDQQQSFDKQQQLDDLTDQVSKFEQLLDMRRIEIESLEAELETSKNRYLQLQREASDWKNQHSQSSEETIEELKEQGTKYKHLSESLQTQIESLLEIIANEKEHSEELTFILDRYQQQENNRKENATPKHDDSEKLLKTKEKLESQLSNIQSEISLWKNQVDILKQTCRALEDGMSDIIAERDLLKEVEVNLRHEVQRLQRELKVSERASNMDKESQKIQQVLSLDEQEVERLKTKNEQLQELLEDVQEKALCRQRELMEVKVQLEEYSMKLNSRERTIEHAHSELKYAQNQVSDLRKEIVEQRYKYEDLSKEYTLVKKDCERIYVLQDLNERLEHELDSAEDQLDKLQQKFDDALTNASAKVCEHAKSVDELAKQNNVLAIELDKAYNTISKVENELAAKNRKFKTVDMIKQECYRTEMMDDKQDFNYTEKVDGFKTTRGKWNIIEPMLAEESKNSYKKSDKRQHSSYGSISKGAVKRKDFVVF